MATYVFALPIQPGKADAMRKYTQEMNGARREEFHGRNRKLGLKIIQVWIQKTPGGELALIRWETDDPKRVYQQMLESDDPFEQWFREKIISDVFGRDPSGPNPPINEQILDYQGEKAAEKQYQETGKR